MRNDCTSNASQLWRANFWRRGVSQVGNQVSTTSSTTTIIIIIIMPPFLIQQRYWECNLFKQLFHFLSNALKLASICQSNSCPVMHFGPPRRRKKSLCTLPHYLGGAAYIEWTHRSAFWHRPARQVLLLVPGCANGLLIEVNVALWSSPCSWECHTGWLMTHSPLLPCPSLSSLPQYLALILLSLLTFTSGFFLHFSTYLTVPFTSMRPCDQPSSRSHLFSCLFLSVSLKGRGRDCDDTGIWNQYDTPQQSSLLSVSNGFTLPRKRRETNKNGQEDSNKNLIRRKASSFTLM